MVAKRYDPKVESLVEAGVLNPHVERVKDPLFIEHDFFDSRDLLQVKYEMIRRVVLEGQSVTKASHTFGFSRPSFYKALTALREKGLAGLIPKKPGPHEAHKLNQDVMLFVQRAIKNDSSLSVNDLSQKIRSKFGFSIHPRSIERALARPKKKS